MKIKKSTLINLAYVISFIIICLIFYLITKSYIPLFICNFALCLAIVIKCKFSMFSLKMIIVNYILLPLLYQMLTGSSYGLLELGLVELNYFVILISIMLYNIVFIILINTTNVLEKEKEKIDNKFIIRGKTKYLLALLAIASIIIAFPRLPFSYNSSGRFQALLPGNAWNHITIICLIFLIGNLKNDKLIQFTYGFCIFWFLSHYERVDTIGLLLLLVIIFFVRKKIKINMPKLLIIGTIFLIIFSTMTYVGVKRSKSNDIGLLKNLIVQSTASDLAYVYNISIDYSRTNSKLYGITFIQYFIEAIPFLEYDKSVTKLLSNEYVFPGGEFILSSSIMNFGVFFVPIFAILEFWILYRIIISRKNITVIIYLFFVAATFRINWYGINYIETGMIYVIPFIYIVFTKILKSLEFEENRYE